MYLIRQAENVLGGNAPEIFEEIQMVLEFRHFV
jgi:hypothetical protein